MFVISLTIGLAYQTLSWPLFAFDIGFLLFLTLIIQPKRLKMLLVQSKSSRNVSSMGVGGETSSISVVSDSTKSFLSSFPGQMARMLESQKIYPNSGVIVAGTNNICQTSGVGRVSHPSSSPSYESGSDPSSHLYESPKNLFTTTKSSTYFRQNHKIDDDSSVAGLNGGSGGYHTGRKQPINRNQRQQHGLFTLRDNLFATRSGAAQFTPTYSFTSIENEIHPDLCNVMNYHTTRLSKPTQQDFYYAYDRHSYSPPS